MKNYTCRANARKCVRYGMPILECACGMRFLQTTKRKTACSKKCASKYGMRKVRKTK
jgi:hypothetical protein